MKVFLSYAARDARIAKIVASRLSEAGFSVWNPADQIMPGDNWALELGRALNKADAIVVLLSPAALAAPTVQREIDFALGNPRFKGRLVPVVVRPVKSIPWILETLPTFKITSDPDRASRQVVQALRRIKSAA